MFDYILKSGEFSVGVFMVVILVANILMFSGKGNFMKQLKLNNVSAKNGFKKAIRVETSVLFLHCTAAPPRGSARNCLKAISKTRI